jgi:ATP-dependent exoDNAse (exonuclease V) beta subunit
VKDVPPTVLRERLDAYITWRQSHGAAIAAARVPSVQVVTATQAARTLPAPGDPEVTVEVMAGGPARPQGRRFGTLVHALLSDMPLGTGTDPEAAEAVLARLGTAQARILGANGDEIAAAQQIARLVLTHPLLRDAARAAGDGRCYRELPVTCMSDDGLLVEGTADLAYDTGAGFVVVDFKTDRPEGDRLEQYRRQVGWYTAAIARATGKPARGVVMVV